MPLLCGRWNCLGNLGVTGDGEGAEEANHILLMACRGGWRPEIHLLPILEIAVWSPATQGENCRFSNVVPVLATSNQPRPEFVPQCKNIRVPGDNYLLIGASHLVTSRGNRCSTSPPKRFKLRS